MSRSSTTLLERCRLVDEAIADSAPEIENASEVRRAFFAGVERGDEPALEWAQSRSVRPRLARPRSTVELAPGLFERDRLSTPRYARSSADRIARTFPVRRFEGFR